MIADFDVIIVGAGAAGIAAAIELQKTSLSFIVLEARNRPGGRAYTDRETFAPTPVDLGASWIHQYGFHNPMYSYYQQFKAVTQAISENDEEEHLLNLSPDGKPLSPDSEHQADMIYKHFITRLEKFASDTEELNDRSIQDVIQADYEQLADTHGHLKPIIDCCLADIEMYEASDLAELSAKEWRTPQESVRCDQWVSYGYGTLLERIVDQHKLAIRLNTLVTHIDTRNSDQIAVKVSNIDSPIFCRYVLITVPLGCLKRETIAFEPPLPEWKREAIGRMGFGLLNKCILQFSDCFWNLMAITVLRTCNEPRSRFHYIVCLPPPANILILLLSGANAAELENAADSEILSHAMKFLQQIFPQYVVLDPIKYKFTRWSQDPLSFGSYSNFAVHSNQHTTELLARETEDGRLHWAGEHTYVNDDTNESANGCVHSAFLSGGRAAAAIRARILSGTSSNTT